MDEGDDGGLDCRQKRSCWSAEDVSIGVRTQGKFCSVVHIEVTGASVKSLGISAAGFENSNDMMFPLGAVVGLLFLCVCRSNEETAGDCTVEGCRFSLVSS